MCTSKIRIINRSDCIDPLFHHPLYYTCSCNKCDECLKRRVSDEYQRAYAEYEYTRQLGGFSLFDTLTYAPKYLPRYRGMECFRYEDFQKAYKRIKTNVYRWLVKHGYKNFPQSGFLNYQIVSEYGGKKHRPHMHVIFNVRCPIPVMVFRDIVCDSWHYGFIDHRYTTMERVLNSTSAISYLTKYFSKDYEFQKTINEILERKRSFYGNKLFNKLYPTNVIRNIFPFNKHGYKFGYTALSLTPDDIKDKGLIRVPDPKSVYRHVSMSKYLDRKYNYLECCDIKSHRLKWVLSDEGLERKVKQLDNSINQLAQKYDKILSDSFVLACTDNDIIRNLRNLSLNNLGSRSTLDLATYSLVYKDRINLTNFIPNYKDFYRASISPSPDNRCISHLTKDNLQYFETEKYLDMYDENGVKHISSDIPLYEKKFRKRPYITFNVNGENRTLYLEDLQKKIINQDSSPMFSKFDDILRCFDIMLNSFNVNKANYNNHINNLKSKFKLYENH